MSARIDHYSLSQISLCLDGAGRAIANLLSWADHPDTEPVGDEWLTGIRAQIHSAFADAERVLRRHEAALPAGLLPLMREANRQALDLAAILHSQPELTTVPYTHWESPRYKAMVDDLWEAQKHLGAVVVQAETELKSVPEQGPEWPSPEQPLLLTAPASAEAGGPVESPKLIGSTERAYQHDPTERAVRTKLALALLLTVGANANRIAKEVGVKRTTLLGWREFQTQYRKVRSREDAERAERKHRRQRQD